MTAYSSGGVKRGEGVVRAEAAIISCVIRTSLRKQVAGTLPPEPGTGTHRFSIRPNNWPPASSPAHQAPA
jgi:hypothetical protein